MYNNDLLKSILPHDLEKIELKVDEIERNSNKVNQILENEEIKNKYLKKHIGDINMFLRDEVYGINMHMIKIRDLVYDILGETTSNQKNISYRKKIKNILFVNESDILRMFTELEIKSVRLELHLKDLNDWMKTIVSRLERNIKEMRKERRISFINYDVNKKEYINIKKNIDLLLINIEIEFENYLKKRNKNNKEVLNFIFVLLGVVIPIIIFIPEYMEIRSIQDNYTYSLNLNEKNIYNKYLEESSLEELVKGKVKNKKIKEIITKKEKNKNKIKKNELKRIKIIKNIFFVFITIVCFVIVLIY